MSNDLIYVYCISDDHVELLPDLILLGLYSIAFGNFQVIVRNVHENEFSEENLKKNLSDLPWLEINAREHIRVLSLIMKKHSLIPFKFGTIFHSKETVKNFIDDYSDSLIENFNRLRDQVEWSVKIYCNRKLLCEQIDELSNDAADLEKQIMASSPGKAFLLKRKKTDLIENEMDRICANFGQDSYDQLKNLSESAGLNNLLPKEFTGREDTMILNASFLVKNNNVSEIKRIVESFRNKNAKSGFSVEASGPWPPFSFISIKEKM